MPHGRSINACIRANPRKAQKSCRPCLQDRIVEKVKNFWTISERCQSQPPARKKAPVLEQCGSEERNARSEGLTALSENGSKTMSEAAASSGRADGLTSLSEGSNNNAKSSRQFGKKHPSPRFNSSMAVKDGRLLEGQLGRGPCARFETPIEQGSQPSQKAPNCTASSEKAPFATL